MAGDHGRIVVRMHEDQTAFAGQRVGVFAGRLEGFPMRHHLRAEAARALHLHCRRVARHHDHRGNAEPLTVVRHALRVVTGAHRDHAAPALFRR